MLGDPCPTSGGDMLRMAGDPSSFVSVSRWLGNEEGLRMMKYISVFIEMKEGER